MLNGTVNYILFSSVLSVKDLTIKNFGCKKIKMLAIFY